MCRRGRPKKQTQFLEQLTFEIKRLEQVEIDKYRNAENKLKSKLEEILKPTPAKRLITL
jgi:hypothetical protein